MTAGLQKTDFNYINDVVDGLIKSLDFNHKGKRYPQYWDMGSGKSLSVRRFAERIWKKIKSKKKLVISKNISFDKKNYKIGKEFTANDKDTIEENSLYQPIPRNWTATEK